MNSRLAVNTGIFFVVSWSICAEVQPTQPAPGAQERSTVPAQPAAIPGPAEAVPGQAAESAPGNPGTTGAAQNVPQPVAGQNISEPPQAQATPTGRGAHTQQQIAVRQDHAYSAGDQKILNAIRRDAAQFVGSGGAASPVHFAVRNGSVHVVGTLPSAEYKDRLLNTIMNTPRGDTDSG